MATTGLGRARSRGILAGSGMTALWLMMVPATAWAQDAAPPADPPADAQTTPTPAPGQTNEDESGEVVVTGIRASVRNSINLKRREDSIVEAVSAEDIGKLPDVSVAESIARLPGLAAQRVAGRAQIISVRGFSPDFTTVLLNGRQQASSGFNRAVEFDQYPSELLGSVVVYKSPDASISGMGLAGTVDLRTIRPLSQAKSTVAVNLRGTYDQGGGRNADISKWGWRGSASYIGHNADKTLGWAIGYAHLDSPGHTNHTKNWYYQNYGGPTYTLSGQEIFAQNRRDIRDGIMGTLEWQPDDRLHSVIDVYWSRFKQHEVNRGAQWFSTQDVDGTTFSNLETETRDGNQFAVSGTASNVIPILRFDDNRRTDKLFAVGFNNEYKITDRTTFTADLSYSSNKRDETYLETYGGYGAGPFQTRTPDSYDFEIPANGHPQYTNWGLDYADASQVSLGDRAPWGGWGHDGLMKSPHIKETLYGLDGALTHEFDGSFLKSVEAGLNYTHRKKTKTVDELDLFLKNGREQVLVDSQYLTDPTSLGFAGFGDVLGFQVADALDAYYDLLPLEDAAHFDKAWSIKEDILTFKAKANIEAGALHGNVGVQIVQQKQSSSGVRINQTVSPIALSDVTITDKYTDVLPSLNLSYDITGQHRLRLAAAKVMARPRMDDLRANLTPSFNGGICAGDPGCSPGQTVNPWSASGGNPELQPWRAKLLNVAYEWYGGNATYFSVSAFQMWLDNYIYTQLRTADFSDFPLPSTAESIPDDVIISPIGQISQPANGDGGKVRGIEVSGALELGKLTPILTGFGVQGSASYSKFDLKPNAEGSIGILPGFSKWVYNLTGYYERNGFQARASYRYRSGFKGEVVSLFANLGYPMILADKQLDAQVGYTFPEGTNLANFGIQLQVNNVLNSPYRTTYDVNGTRTLETYDKFGRQWMLGVSKRF